MDMEGCGGVWGEQEFWKTWASKLGSALEGTHSHTHTHTHTRTHTVTHTHNARSHNDTYAESFHRDFFSNWARGVPPEKCVVGTQGHNTAQIGGFVVSSAPLYHIYV